MKGHSNFAGHKHTHATKIQIGISQEGHRNAKDHKWVTDKESGVEHRVKGGVPKGMRKGRTRAFSQWIHAKEEKEVWDKPNPNTSHDKLSSQQKAKAKARAKAAGRPYPNMVDNIWAARNEEVDQNKPENREMGTDSLAQIYAKNTPGQTMKKSKLNEIINRFLGEKKEDNDVPFEGPYTKAGPDTIKDKSGAIHTPMSRARHLARMALAQKKLRKENLAARRVTNEVRSEYSKGAHDDDAQAFSGKPPKDYSQDPVTRTRINSYKDKEGNVTHEVKQTHGKTYEVTASKHKSKDAAEKARADIQKKYGISEEEVNELSKTTLSNYANDAALDAVRLGNTLGRSQQTGSKKSAQVAGDKITKRLAGIRKAVTKLQK